MPIPPSRFFLSETDLEHLTRAAEILHAPFAFGSLDGWREAVNDALVKVIRGELAIFFILPGEGGTNERELIVSSGLSADQRADFLRDALYDAGTDRALA